LVSLHRLRRLESASICIHQLVPDDDIPAVVGIEGVPVTLMRRNPLLSIGAVVLLIGQAAGQAPNRLGLTQAVEAALETHPLIRSARLQADQARNRAAEARAARTPIIRISETVTRGNNPVFVFGSLLEQGRFGPQNFALPALNNPDSLTNLRTVVSAGMPLFDGMKTSSRIAQSNIGGDQAARQIDMAEQRIRFEVLEQYFGVQVSEAALTVAAEAVRMAESDIQRARDRMDSGLAVASDVLAAQVQFAEFKQQRIQAEGEMNTAMAALNISIGSPANVPQVLTVPLVKKTFAVASVDEFIERALLHRPDHQQAQSGIELAERRVSERRSEYLPELNVFASIGSSARSLTTGSTDYTMGAGVSFNLFDRGRPARLGQALVDKRLAETERDRVADQIRMDVVRACNRFQSAEEQLQVAEAALTQATEGLRILQDRYEAGLATITDVLRAETALVRTQMNVAVSRHNHYLGYANVLLSIGELNDVKAFEP
jgi:outer membrane protein